MEKLEGVEIEHNDFIGVYKNVLNDKQCDTVIEFFDNFSTVHGYYADRREQTGNSDHVIKDDSILMDDLVYGMKRVESQLPPGELQRHLQCVHEDNGILTRVFDAFEEYVTHYDIWKSGQSWTSRTFKLQKTQAGDGSGYHVWHSEFSAGCFRDRFAAWILYLNDVDEGGETEFLYQSTRVKPRKGDLVIWPAYFTHVHRGNPPLTGDKYVMTGWLEVFESINRV